MYKAIHDESPKPLQKSLTIENEFFFFKTPRIKQTKKSMHFAGPHLWNSLPTELVEECNFVKFKDELKKVIINK